MKFSEAFIMKPIEARANSTAASSSAVRTVIAHTFTKRKQWMSGEFSVPVALVPSAWTVRLSCRGQGSGHGNHRAASPIFR
jgi:hypothetical protein